MLSVLFFLPLAMFQSLAPVPISTSRTKKAVLTCPRLLHLPVPQGLPTSSLVPLALYPQLTLQYKHFIFSCLKTTPTSEPTYLSNYCSVFLFHFQLIRCIDYFSLFLIFWFKLKPYPQNSLTILNQYSSIIFSELSKYSVQLTIILQMTS